MNHIFLFLDINSGNFYHASPNWFDWLALLVSVGSIFAVWILSTRIYNKQKKDSEANELKNQQTDISLFDENVKYINKQIQTQIEYLNECEKDGDKFKLMINSNLQVGFLQYVNPRSLYSKGKDEARLTVINELFSALFSLSDLTMLLHSELRTALAKYDHYNDIFRQQYRRLLDTQYLELSNKQASRDATKQGYLIYDDEFFNEYSNLRKDYLSEYRKTGIFSPSDLIKHFITPMTNIAKKYFPENYDAIQAYDLAEQIQYAYEDREETLQAYKKSITSHKETLKAVQTKINAY